LLPTSRNERLNTIFDKLSSSEERESFANILRYLDIVTGNFVFIIYHPLTHSLTHSLTHIFAFLCFVCRIGFALQFNSFLIVDFSLSLHICNDNNVRFI
jgi:hypothetical protein